MSGSLDQFIQAGPVSKEPLTLDAFNRALEDIRPYLKPIPSNLSVLFPVEVSDAMYDVKEGDTLIVGGERMTVWSIGPNHKSLMVTRETS